MKTAKQTVIVEKWPGNWSPPTFEKKNMFDALEWMSKHGYTARRAHEFTDDAGQYIRHVTYYKPGCKTEYAIRFTMVDSM